MMEASKDAQSDLQKIMDGVKTQTAAKQKLREEVDRAHKDIAAAIAANNKAPANAPCNIPACRSAAEAATQLTAMTAQSKRPLRYSMPNQLSYAQVEQELDKMKKDLDSLSEMGETESLRLQMAMDRMSKFMATLSNIMKKMSDTSSAMIQNLK